LGTLVDEAGGVTIDVGEKLLRPGTGGQLVPLFPTTGPLRMSGKSAVAYLTFRGPGETELDRFVRARRFWEAILGRFRARPREFGRAMATLARAGALDAAPREVVEFFTALAAAAPGRRTYQVLPVDPVGAGGAAEAYAVDPARLDALVRALFGGSRPQPGPGVGARVAILNGNGLPEVGARVAARLVPAGMKILVSGNADSFDVRRTLITIYSEDPASRALADLIRRLLGVGRIQLGRRVQTVVDVTVTVGSDFPPRARRSSPSPSPVAEE
ncbi:MAG: LCP family protein, partial [Candidatus Binatia bacterium]